MAVNLPDLSNGLKLINTGVIPGDQRGDSFRTVLEKINSNSSITLTANDSLANTGLFWNSTTRKMSLNIPLNYIPVNDGIYPYNLSQFGIVNDTFQIIGIDSTLLTGNINPAINKITLASNHIFYGDITNSAAAKTVNPIHFILNSTSQYFEINNLEYEKLIDISVLRSHLNADDVEFLVDPIDDVITIGLIDWDKISNVEVRPSQLLADPVEFDLTGSLLEIGLIDWDKISDVAVRPTQLLANTSEFDLGSPLLAIGVIDFTKIANVFVAPIQMALNPYEFFTGTPLLTVKNIDFDKITNVEIDVTQLKTDNDENLTTLANSNAFLAVSFDDDTVPTFHWYSFTGDMGTF